MRCNPLRWLVGMVLVIGLLGFVATSALSKFLMRGEVIE